MLKNRNEESMEDSDWRTIKLVIAGMTGFFAIVILVLAATGNLVSASQVIQEAIYKGTGTIDVEILGENQNARAAAHNSKDIDIRYSKSSISTQYEGTTDKLTITYSVTGDGTRWTKFKYQAEGANAGDSADFNKINGSFEASGTSVISVSENGDVSFDSVTSAEEGNYTFRAKFYDISDGAMRPTSGETVIGYGNLSVWRHINKTDIKTSEDWLKLCADLNKDMILDPTVPSGTYIVPDGYYVNKAKQLIKIPDGQTYLDGELVTLPAGYELDDGKLVKNSDT